MPDAHLKNALYAAARDENQHRLRRDMCAALAIGLAEVGKSARLAGSLIGPQRANGNSPFENGDDTLVALGYLAQTAASLISAALTVHRDGNLYAAAALNRQLVEVEYLAWAFSDDLDEASSWLRTTYDDRKRRWTPRHVRERSAERFRGTDYGAHCEIGGHPTPQGLRAMFRVDNDDLTRELIIAETAQHGTSAWDYLISAIVMRCQEQGMPPEGVVPNDAATQVGDAERLWRSTETLMTIWRSREPDTTST